MQKVKHYEKYLHLFDAYKHSIPVIYATLEGQYDGELYVDSEEHPTFAVLFTQFAFHFVAGDSNAQKAEALLDDLIFKRYLKETSQKEACLFCPDEKWNYVLDHVFEKRSGIKDYRKTFHLNREKFENVRAKRKPLEDVEAVICYEQNEGAKKPYPVCRIYHDDESVSFCSGFMLGRGQAEIDVRTEEAFQRKGYAKEAAIALVEELLNHEIEPSWCTWPYRTESQQLALSIGFEPLEDVSVHIWVESECGEIR